MARQKIIQFELTAPEHEQLCRLFTWTGNMSFAMFPGGHAPTLKRAIKKVRAAKHDHQFFTDEDGVVYDCACGQKYRRGR